MATFPWVRAATELYFGETWAPLARLPLRAVDGRVTLNWFLVDTGAPISLARYSVAQLLGFNLERGTPATIRGIGGAQTTTYVHEVPIEIDGRDLRVPIAFAVTNGVPNLFGRHGIFDSISIRLDHRKKTTTLAWRL